jgi:hypothetical protein
VNGASGRPLSEPVEVNVSGLRGTPAQVAAELRRLADEVEQGRRFTSSASGCAVSVDAAEDEFAGYRDGLRGQRTR